MNGLRLQVGRRLLELRRGGVQYLLSEFECGGAARRGGRGAAVVRGRWTDTHRLVSDI